MGEQRRECSGQVGGAPVSDFGRGEGRLSAPRLTWASVESLGHLGPKHGHEAELHRSDVVEARRKIEANGARGVVPYLGMVLVGAWHDVWSSEPFGMRACGTGELRRRWRLCARRATGERNETGERGRVCARLKRSWGCGARRGSALSAFVRAGRVAVAGKKGLTSGARVSAAAHARWLASVARGGVAMALTRRAHGVESRGARGSWHRLVGLGWQREEERRHVRGELGLMGQKAERRSGVRAAFGFSFILNLQSPFLFIFSFEFKSNQAINSNLNISSICIKQRSKFKLSMMQQFMSL
jgi:hypothetical protein